MAAQTAPRQEAHYRGVVTFSARGGLVGGHRPPLSPKGPARPKRVLEQVPFPQPLENLNLFFLSNIGNETFAIEAKSRGSLIDYIHLPKQLFDKFFLPIHKAQVLNSRIIESSFERGDKHTLDRVFDLCNCHFH